MEAGVRDQRSLFQLLLLPPIRQRTGFLPVYSSIHVHSARKLWDSRFGHLRTEDISSGFAGPWCVVLSTIQQPDAARIIRFRKLKRSFGDPRASIRCPVSRVNIVDNPSSCERLAKRLAWQLQSTFSRRGVDRNGKSDQGNEVGSFFI